MAKSMRDICAAAPVIPVIKIARLEDALALAAALRDGGLSVLEVTLRTPVALQAISLIRQQVEGVCVGAGTVLNAGDVARAKAAGSEFIVSPGATEQLLAACATSDLPFMPGVATAGEAMRCLEAGLDMVKFFPAQQIGGSRALNALAQPLAGLYFCPTGGIGLDTMADYLRLPCVPCVGGSWMASESLQAKGDWAGVREAAQLACARAQQINGGSHGQ